MNKKEYEQKRCDLLDLASDLLSSPSMAADFDRVRELHDQVMKLDRDYNKSKKK
jgi:hypothetical protein